MALLDLPPDVLCLVLSYLPPQDFLAFCKTSRLVYDEYRQESLYWRTETNNTFRLPISPLLAADGPRWYWLYKRLLTQTQLYTWGQGLGGNLGLGRSRSVPRRLLRTMPQTAPARVLPRVPARPDFARRPPGPVFERVQSSWPTETEVPPEVRVIADLQCGGWSTTILSSAGKLYTAGSISHRIGGTEESNRFVPLDHLTQSTTAVRQFSSGRSHVLGLTDDGEIISWDRTNAKGLKILPRSAGAFGGRPSRVAAGWAESSAYVPNTGILFWTPIQNDQRDDMLDGVHVKETVIPGTARTKTENGIVEVVKHILLESYVLWITSDSRLYACSLRKQSPDQLEPDHAPMVIPGFASPDREFKDLQGQFQRFGLFTASGQVLSGDTGYLDRCMETLREHPDLLESNDWSTMTTLLSSRPEDVPALQHSGVIALAFGDHHYHALHAGGHISSYGRDSQSCGSLGLSGPENGGRFRGLRRERQGLRGDSRLLPIANVRGRQVWFEPEKKDWLQWMEDQLHEPAIIINGRPGHQDWDGDETKQALFSEWVEQEGRHWEQGPAIEAGSLPSAAAKPATESTGDYAHLGAYFPIAIAAAGWHSGALVLVDEEKEHEVRSKWVVTREAEGKRSMPGAFDHLEPDETYIWRSAGFPKVQLPNGIETTGEGEPRPWRDGMPTMSELGFEG